MTKLIALSGLSIAPTEFPIIVVFHKRPGPTHSLVMRWVRKCQIWKEVDMDGEPFVVAAFSKAGFGAAMNVIEQVGFRKSSQVFVDGHPTRDFAKLFKMLQCYRNSRRSKNVQRFCQSTYDPSSCRTNSVTLTVRIVIPDLEDAFGIPKVNIQNREAEAKVIVPCKLVQKSLTFSHAQIDKAEAFIERAAIESLCDRCPNYDANSIQIISD